jgi:uncharacterized protein YjbJ (UPF0337 family)
MNKQRIKGSWNQIMGNAKERSGDNALIGEGQDQKIIGRAQTGIGRVRDRFRRFFGGV